MYCTARAALKPNLRRSKKCRNAARMCSTSNSPGYAYANWFKPRPAFRFSAEDSIYVAEHARGRGIGRLLLEALCRECEAAGVRKLIAVIGDSSNAGSIGVHRAMGFEHAGTLRNVGWKLERWLDVVMMEKSLGAGSSTAPV